MRQLTVAIDAHGKLTRAAVFSELSKGTWNVEIPSGPHKRFMDIMVQTVGLYRLGRNVYPHEGDLYLEALRETFGRSTGMSIAERDVGESGARLALG